LIDPGFGSGVPDDVLAGGGWEVVGVEGGGLDGCDAAGRCVRRCGR
jgi:hypothetical protein